MRLAGGTHCPSVIPRDIFGNSRMLLWRTVVAILMLFVVRNVRGLLYSSHEYLLRHGRPAGSIRRPVFQFENVRYHPSYSASNGERDQEGASSVLERLEDLRLTELRDLLKKLGGKPGGLRKAEIVQTCHKLLLSKAQNLASIEDIDATKASTVNIDPPQHDRGQVQVQSPAFPRTSTKSHSKFENSPVIKSSQPLRPLPPPARQQHKSSTHPSTDISSSRLNLLPTPEISAPEKGRNSSKVRSLQPLRHLITQSTHRADQEQFRFPYGSQRNMRLSEDVETADMDVTFLGTASCVPSLSRGVSCVALRSHSDMWLFDCGESSQLQLQKSRVRPSKIKKIFLTHAHGDHSFGLPGVLCLVGQSTQEERGAAERSNQAFPPIDIFGPEGTRDLVRATIQLTYSRVVAPFRVHELKNVPYLHGRCVKWMPPVPNVRTQFDPYYGEQRGGRDIYPDENGLYHLFEEGELSVAAAPMQHTVPCVGYSVTEATRPGRLRIERIRDAVEKNKDGLRQAGMKDPNMVYKLLKNLKINETYTLPDGTQLSGSDILDPPRPGRKIVIMGDTCTGEHMIPLAKDADVVIHEATNAYFPEMDGGRFSSYDQLERDTFLHGHSTPQMAAAFAKKVNAKRLVLTHFSPRYRGDDCEASMRIMWQIEDMARKTAAPLLQGRNDVIAAWDQLSLAIPLKESDNEEAKNVELRRKERAEVMSGGELNGDELL